MTTNRRTPAHLVRWHVGNKITVHVGGFSTDGWLALVIITIILAGRLVRCIVRAAWVILALAVPPVTRFVLRYVAGLYLWFRAFYTH
jgi:hypothetical protein